MIWTKCHFKLGFGIFILVCAKEVSVQHRKQRKRARCELMITQYRWDQERGRFFLVQKNRPGHRLFQAHALSTHLFYYLWSWSKSGTTPLDEDDATAHERERESWPPAIKVALAALPEICGITPRSPGEKAVLPLCCKTQWIRARPASYALKASFRRTRLKMQ